MNTPPLLYGGFDSGPIFGGWGRDEGDEMVMGVSCNPRVPYLPLADPNLNLCFDVATRFSRNVLCNQFGEVPRDACLVTWQFLSLYPFSRPPILLHLQVEEYRRKCAFCITSIDSLFSFYWRSIEDLGLITEGWGRD
jgi:hypothetical protein